MGAEGFGGGLPGGDSVTCVPTPTAKCPRPSRLRITVHYTDGECDRVGVPPESIWVTVQSVSGGGNLRINDKGTKIFADDSTDGAGSTRITVPSFSGCGRLRFLLYVSESFQGSKVATVRTTDPNADGRTGSSEYPCDLNYDGLAGTVEDAQAQAPHADHWHRNALHGTLVKRTNLCDLCPVGDPNTIGDGKMAWSPSGRYVSFDIDDPVIRCKIYLAPASPTEGNSPTQFTFPTTPDSADYDASWSPLGDEIVFQRRDRVIYRKPVPWLGTFETAIIGEQSNAITYPAISPDGKTIAYCRAEGALHIYTVPIGGGSPKRVTSEAGVFDRYPEWSPDGSTLVFERFIPATEARHLYKVAPGDAVPSPVPFHAPSAEKAVLPSYSPDSLVIVAGLGPTASAPVVATLETAPAGPPKPITSNYSAYTYQLLSPRLAPDGTRLGLIAKNPAIPGALSPQIWAARRNMSLPPRITRVGTQVIADTTSRVLINAARGLSSSITIGSTDPEGDAVRCRAFFLQDGMTFDTTTCTLNWTPSAPVGTTFHVKFQVTTNSWPRASGGTDAVIAVLTVVAPLGPQSAEHSRVEPQRLGQTDGSNPTRGRFAVLAPSTGGTAARLTVFDLSGRRIASVRGASGSLLVWEGRDDRGAAVAPGIYLYRLDIGTHHQAGRIVMIR